MTISEIKKLLKQGESLTVEFKEKFNKRVIETACAFANTTGGNLIIGVNNHGVVKGVNIGKETIQNWINEISQKTEPVIFPEIKVVEIENKTLVIIQILEYPLKPILTKGRCFKRIENSNHRMSAKEIAEMHLLSTGTSWDAFPVLDKSIKNIDLNKAKKYIKIAKITNRRHFDKTLKTVDILKKLELIKNKKPTWASLLLFGKDSQSSLSQATIHCGKFKNNVHIMDNRMINGSIIDQVDEVMIFVKKHINVKFVISGKPKRDEIWDYPLDAIREAIINAICHRDYSDNADIQIKIFDDRMTIWSPGFLLSSITLEELLDPNHSSKPRNKQIAQIFYDLELIERYGSGIYRIINECKKALIPQPEFKNFSGGFIVIFHKKIESQPESQPELQPESQPELLLTDKIISLLKHKSLSKSDISKQLGQKSVSGQLNKIIRKMINLALIDYTIPEKPNSRLQKYKLRK